MWLGAGTVLARVPGFDSDLPFALLFPPLGLITGIIFSGKLVGIERGRGFDRASLVAPSTTGPRHRQSIARLIPATFARPAFVCCRVASSMLLM